MATLTSLTQGTVAEYFHSLDSGVDKKHVTPKVVNVKDHGATGDGVTDDKDFIQAAINAAYGTMPDDSFQSLGQAYNNGELYFPPGDYRVTGSLVVCETTGTKIYGAGVGVTHLHLDATGAEGNSVSGVFSDIVPLWLIDHVQEATISDMTWSCDGATPFITKTTNASSAAGTGVLHFADASGVVVNDLVYNYTNPPSLDVSGIETGQVTAVDDPSPGDVTVDVTFNGSGVASGDTIYFATSCIGFWADQSGTRSGITSSLTFKNITINGFSSGIVARGTAGNAENFILDNVWFNDCSLAGFRVTTFNTLNYGIFGGGANNCGGASTHKVAGDGGVISSGNFGAAYSIPAGSIPHISGVHTTGDGWAYVTSSTQGASVAGCRFENKRAISSVGALLDVYGCTFTGGDDTDGALYVSCYWSGVAVLTACEFAPTDAISPASRNYIVQGGGNGSVTLRECKFEGHADEMGLQGDTSTNCRVRIENSHGSSVPSTATMFASFGGRIERYTEFEGCTVADLPTSHAKYTGLRGWVTDANATTYMSTVAGGGSNIVKVICNGTNWVIG